MCLFLLRREIMPRFARQKKRKNWVNSYNKLVRQSIFTGKITDINLHAQKWTQLVHGFNYISKKIERRMNMISINPESLSERENYKFLTGSIIPRPVALVTTQSHA